MAAVRETPDLATEDAGAELSPEGSKWYVIHTYSGYEKKVKKNPDWRIEFIPEDELEELKHAGFLTISNPNRWCVNYLSNACFGIQNMAEVFYDDDVKNQKNA